MPIIPLFHLWKKYCENYIWDCWQSTPERREIILVLCRKVFVCGRAGIAAPAAYDKIPYVHRWPFMHPLAPLEIRRVISATSVQQSCMLKSWSQGARVLLLWVGRWPSWFLMGPHGPASTVQQLKRLRRNSTRKVSETCALPRRLPLEGSRLVLGLSFHSHFVFSSAL